MARLLLVCLCFLTMIAAVVGALAGSGQAVSGTVVVTATVGPTRLISPGFGYSVAYRTVASGARVSTSIGLFLYEDGRWRNVTPPMLRADGVNAIDDVTFLDRRHGWVAAYNCATVAVSLYRTSDGGRSWQSLGRPTEHSCGGGPTFLSFVDSLHGWMEPVSPNGPEGQLLGTNDGGRTWRHLASGPPGQIRPPALPCLAPIRFVSPQVGWIARCEDGRIFSTADGGRSWRPASIPIHNPSAARFDLPVFAGETGVVAATLGTQPMTAAGNIRAVVFSVSRDGGRRWAVQSTREVARCPLTPYYTALWPASVADAHVWWIVAGRSRPLVQVTTDSGRRWRTAVARGLPSGACSVISVSAADANDAWVVARQGKDGSALFGTRDGGRSWRSTVLLHP